MNDAADTNERGTFYNDQSKLSGDEGPAGIRAAFRIDDDVIDYQPFPSGYDSSGTSSLMKAEEEGDYDYDDDDDFESLAAKASALASIPVTNYTKRFAIKERNKKRGKGSKKNKKKYTTEKFKEKVLCRAKRDTDPNSVVLANKTSNIMSEFQDYLSEIESQIPGARARALALLDYEPGRMAISSKATSEDGKGEQRGLMLTKWGKRFGSPERKSPSDSDRNIYEIPKGKEDGDEDQDGSIGSSLSAGTQSKEERRILCYYTYAVFRSKKFKLSIAGVFLLCVLIGYIIGVTSGGSTENVQQQYLERVEGLGKSKEEHAWSPPQKDVDFYEFEEVNENRDKIWNSIDGDQEGPSIKVETHQAVGLSMDQKEAQSVLPLAQNDEADAEVTLPYHVVGLPTGEEPSIQAMPDVDESIEPDEPIQSGKSLVQDMEDISDAAPSANEPDDTSISSFAAAAIVAAQSTPPEEKPADQHKKADEETVMPHHVADLPENKESSTPEVEPDANDTSLPDETLMQDVTEKLRPKWFSRATGWKGSTYADSIEFCVSQEMMLCPHEAYCPDAVNLYNADEVLSNGGSKYQWAAVMDEVNRWVQVGQVDTCAVATPEWALHDKGSQFITEHIMCCKLNGLAEGGDSESSNAVSSIDEPDDVSIEPFVAAPDKEDDSDHPSTNEADEVSTESFTTETFEAATNTPLEEELAEQEESAYHDAFELYRPHGFDRTADGWEGKTYLDAQEFCGALGGGICPLDAICPLGEGTRPVGGYLDGTKKSWVPVSDTSNEWVNLSSEGACVKYSLAHVALPDWGLTGEGSEGFTRHLMCCGIGNGKDATSVSTETTPDQQVVHLGLNWKDITEKYAPTWYHRDEESEDGWVGKSYTDAIDHCARHSSIPCPYEAYCPHGPGNAPFEGSRATKLKNEIWAPILDIPNGWVNVGPSADSCKLYDSIHSYPPLWGLENLPQFDEEAVKAMTSHIMCCREPHGGDRVTLRSILSESVGAANAGYDKDIPGEERPAWFSRGQGYPGTTHEDAAVFCARSGGMVLCPTETYCPNKYAGIQRPLFLRDQAFEGEQWAPVVSKSTRSDDKWIMIGKLRGEPRSTCATFGELKGMKPEGWGLDSGEPELKQHVMCCPNPRQTEFDY